MTNFLLHAGSYGIGLLMILVGGVNYFGIHLAGVSVDNPVSVMSGGVALIAASIKADQAKQMAKVIVIAFLLSWCFASFNGARAADLSTAPLVKAKVSAPVPACSLTSCRIWYAFADITGTGTNIDIIGNGLNGSLNSGGATIHGGIGGMSWNGTYALGVEAGCGWMFNQVGSVNGIGAGVNGLDCFEELQFGGNLLNVVAPSAQAPAPVSQLLSSLMFAYAAAGGEQRQFGEAWRTGLGTKFLLDPVYSVILDLGYRYSNGGNVTVDGQVVKAANLAYAKIIMPLPARW